MIAQKLRHLACTGALLALLVGGCGKKRDHDAPPAPAPTISPTERKLATDACGDYVARLCACAATKPELADTCKLKRAKPEAIALALAVADDPSSSADSIARARSEVGKIVARCIEEAAQLPALGCP
jgi:hypothetical protein